MSRIQREECLQLHNAPKKKKKKICEALPFLLFFRLLFFFSVYYSTISRHQLRSEGYIPNSTGSVVRCHAKKRDPSSRALSLERKTARGKNTSAVPPKLSSPSPSFFQGAEHAQCSRAAHLSTKRESFAATEEVERSFEKVQEERCPMQNVIKSISVRSPW